ncbi:PROTEIN FLC EXPRESSOR [Salix purpurea]|uniref:PROTEIN FLC EXPRESSOR n=1 Tax=Salix purpurea TaxID=77065 RepID=A0A9Q0PQS9_SALPP|nr:PROTEIN FLC EXPRESSOR [Salix purpurea]
MAGRNHLQLRETPLSRAAALPRSTTDPRHLHTRPHHHLLEDRISIQHREIQSLLLDNQRLAETHGALKQEVSLSQQDLRHLSTLAADIKAERDNQIREVYQRSLELDAELRSIDAISAELVQVGAIKEEIETVQQEIQRGRSAIEYEKKTRAFNLEQEKVLEKNRILLVREIMKLRTELANAEKRARAAAAAGNPSPGYGRNYGRDEVGYGGSSYPDPNNPQQVQIGGGDSVPTFSSGAMSNGYYYTAHR